MLIRILTSPYAVIEPMKTLVAHLSVLFVILIALASSFLFAGGGVIRCVDGDGQSKIELAEQVTDLHGHCETTESYKHEDHSHDQQNHQEHDHACACTSCPCDDLPYEIEIVTQRSNEPIQLPSLDLIELCLIIQSHSIDLNLSETRITTIRSTHRPSDHPQSLSVVRIL